MTEEQKHSDVTRYFVITIGGAKPTLHFIRNRFRVNRWRGSTLKSVRWKTPRSSLVYFRKSEPPKPILQLIGRE